MKAIFITVLLLTLMVAPSFARPLKIPDAMLGSWCYAGDEGEFVPLSAAPLNSNGVPDCGADDHLFVDRKGYGGHEVWCKAISNIVRRGDAWQVRYRCDKETETVRWQLIKNGTRLKYQVITEAEADEAERRPGWEYDWRRCMVGRNVGNYRFRFRSSYESPHVVYFDIMMKDDLRVPDFKVGSVRLGSASWVLNDGELESRGELGRRAKVLQHLRQGNTLVVYSTDGDSVLRWQIEGGDKAVKFLIDCPRYWERR
jgi:hypothetical protein